ncbi:nuclear factor 7, brain-like [Scomber scombrus]|uniref:nuclear factor 7, brain-like n=1 Tax=Scomber scombrus TaxID=13677 RepID=UPI002DDB9628|nr:nuclear factor 7, brain-like [Scomber scombrus]
MASASYTEDLSCPICLTIFADPVILPCGHSFCRECITVSLKSQHQCPQCRATVPTEENNLLTNHILKSLAEKVKENEKLKNEYRHDKEVAEWLCPEHDEKLKLFCITDQQLTCVICRDGEKHEGHRFKPIKEAAAAVTQELTTFLQQVLSDTPTIESTAKTQREEITKTKEKSHQLMTQISSKFEEMHQFLRKREEEIKNELKHKEEDDVEKMSESLNAIETALSENRELEGKVSSVLEITDPEKFLKSWTEDKTVVTAKSSFRPRGNTLKVVNTSLYLGPYESHLQFFMWKEMLQLIKPREERLTVQSNSANVTVVSQLSSGQHYWEVEVGQREYWEVGGQNSFLKFDGQNYYDSHQNKVLAFAGRPQKIGIYLNCESKELSFYDADGMTHIHTMLPGSMPVSAYFKMAINRNPRIVCWY